MTLVNSLVHYMKYDGHKKLLLGYEYEFQEPFILFRSIFLKIMSYIKECAFRRT